ncbi:MAG: EAL domain-containing protein [Woeseiaceae bacterium]|nr:EAL domain-containing protein [Woeseiaceae bacterium]
MAPPEYKRQTGHAFVVTRDKTTWRLSRKALAAEDYEPQHCAGVDEIEAAAASTPPAVIVLDEDLADDTAVDTCRRIRALPGCEYIPLLLLSSQHGKALDDAYGANVTAAVAKPVEVADLTQRLRSLGDTGRTLSGIRALRPVNADILEAVPDAFLIVGTDGMFKEYLGGANDDPVLAPDELEGRSFNDAWPAAAAKQLKNGIRRVMKARSAHSISVELEKDGRCGQYEVRLLVQGRSRVLLIMRDLADGPAQAKGGRNRVAADDVTGLTSKDAFMAHFESVIADAKLRERGIAVMCIDIDRFNRINDTLGRAIGDAVLRVTAKRIDSCLRDYDQLARIEDSENRGLARIRGDEFVLLLGDIESREDVATVAGRIRDAFAEPVAIEGHQLNIKPSIGIAQCPLDGDTAETLLKNARVALDEAKVISSDGHEFFSSTMKHRARARLDVKNELRWAIDKDQLDIHFLPRIDLQTGLVAGLEALLRWIHPLRGSVPLNEVIPLAEATGLMFAIGEWVINTTCKQARLWQIEYGDVPCVSVNLSQQEFAREDLPLLVQRALENSELPAEKLELEITEAMLMRSRQADGTIHALHRIGVGVVLDDFGQGRSSISHLTNLPIKAIKIDREFTDGVREPGRQQSICSAMIAMSRELGFSVIAEGVESELQVEFLKERGCDAVQGFLFTEPLPPAEVPAFIEACKQIADESKVVDLTTVRKKIASKSFA